MTTLLTVKPEFLITALTDLNRQQLITIAPTLCARMRRKRANIAYLATPRATKGFTRRLTTHRNVSNYLETQERPVNFSGAGFGIGANLVGFPRM